MLPQVREISPPEFCLRVHELRHSFVGIVLSLVASRLGWGASLTTGIPGDIHAFIELVAVRRTLDLLREFFL